MLSFIHAMALLFSSDFKLSPEAKAGAGEKGWGEERKEILDK